MRKTICLLIVSLTINSAFSQSDIALGEWRTHTSYQQLSGVIEANSKIYGYNSFGLFYFDKEDNSLNKLSKLDGLSRMDISTLAYSESNETLLIAYQNGDVDLIREDEIIAFTLISQSPLAGSKKINQILIRNQYAYLLSDFGITLISTETGGIKESYLNLSATGNQLAILQGTIHQDSLFLVTPSGIMAGPLNESTNLQDFNNWKRFGSEVGLPISGFKQIVGSNETLFALWGNLLYQYQNGVWSLLPIPNNPSLKSISVHHPSGIIICTAENLLVYNGSTFELIDDNLILAPEKAIIDKYQKIWIADKSNGLLSNRQGLWASFSPSGPISNHIYSLNFLQKQILALPAPRNTSPNQTISGFSSFKNGSWINHNALGLENITDAAIHEGKFYFSSMKNGLITWDGEQTFEVININDAGVTLNPTQDNYVLVSSLFSDTDNKLWMLNYQANEAIHSLKNNEWTSHIVSTALLGTDILVPYSGHIWIKTNSGITIYDPNNDISRIVGTSSTTGKLPSLTVNDFTEDQDGYVWVATASGVAYFNNILSAFDGDLEAIKPIYENQYLFSEKSVSHVLIDPANRKWFATADGISVFSAFVDTLLFQFDINNSPLPSNQILDMAYDIQSGEVFIATTQGLVSYRDGSTQAGTLHQAEIKVFPNPVAPNFSGQVGISGLAYNAYVKITDVSGRLVYETRSQGGTAVWNVQNLSGQRVNTGIYLVLSSTADGTDTIVAKIAVVN